MRSSLNQAGGGGAHVPPDESSIFYFLNMGVIRCGFVGQNMQNKIASRGGPMRDDFFVTGLLVFHHHFSLHHHLLIIVFLLGFFLCHKPLRSGIFLFVIPVRRDVRGKT